MKSHSIDNHSDTRRRSWRQWAAESQNLLPLAALAAGAALTATADAQGPSETTDVFGQGMGGSVVAPDGAKLHRFETGLNVDLRIPTPAPGSYMYPGPSAFQPEGAYPGHPEAYSLWVFVFNYPQDCLASPCDLSDFSAGRGAGGAFNAAGHVIGGATLQLSGRVSMQSTPFAGSPLLEPSTAEVHLAVAPHGALQPEALPAQITTPIGSPDYWWIAIFD
jgi:hypothetical protein